MTCYHKLLQDAIRVARQAYITSKTAEDRYEWQQLIKQCIVELNETGGRIIR